MNKFSLQKIVGAILILLGTGIFLSPHISDVVNQVKMKLIMQTYIESLQNISVIESENETVLTPTQSGIKTLTREERNEEIKNNWPVEAILSIEKINLLMPVIKDATMAHLDISVSSMEGTGKPWDKNNYVIVGHRSRTYGSHFNRLDELEVTDKILVIDSDGNRYHYEVKEKKIVEEDELSVLDYHGNSELTLITCHPISVKNPSTRLVISAVEILE